jgi:methyl-accepting chemotaxis protein
VAAQKVLVLAEMVRGHVADIRTRIAAHDTCAQQAVEQVAHTLAAAQVIERLARQAKMLALNARIESVRGGEQARGFAVIAEEMTRLSTAVAATNDTVQRLAGSLGGLLPKMAAQAHELSERADAFSTEAGRRLGELDRQVAALRSDVAETDGAQP